jgi:hypothetical protein
LNFTIAERCIPTHRPGAVQGRRDELPSKRWDGSISAIATPFANDHHQIAMHAGRTGIVENPP